MTYAYNPTLPMAPTITAAIFEAPGGYLPWTRAGGVGPLHHRLLDAKADLLDRYKDESAAVTAAICAQKTTP